MSTDVSTKHNYHDQAARAAAADVWVHRKGSLTRADWKHMRHEFRLKCPYLNLARPDKFIKQWGQAWETRHSVEFVKRAGPQPKFDDGTARQAAAAFKAGNAGVHFTSIKEATAPTTGHPFLKDLVDRGCSARTVLKRIKQVDPNLTKKTEQLKWVFSAQQKADRREAAKWCLERLSTDKKFLHAVAFTDHMTIYCMPARRTVWCDKRDDVTVVHASVGRGKKVVKLGFYIAVNAVVGGVAIVFTTGTTDKGGKVYKVILQVARFLQQLPHVLVVLTLITQSHVGVEITKHTYLATRLFFAQFYGPLDTLLKECCVQVVHPEQAHALPPTQPVELRIPVLL